MIRKLTAVFCVLWCVLLLQFAFGKQEPQAQRGEVIETFAGFGLAGTKAYLELTGELGRFSTEKKALEKLEKAAMLLGIPADCGINREEKSNGSVWTVSALCEERMTADPTAYDENSSVCGSGSYRAEGKLIAVKNGFFCDYYLQMTAETPVEPVLIEAARNRLEKIRKEQGLNSLIGIRLSGSFGRILSEEEKQQAENRLLAAAEAERIDTAAEGNLRMTYAYQKALGEALSMNGRLINLNLVFRDNQTQTRCFVGFPAVFSDDEGIGFPDA